MMQRLGAGRQRILLGLGVESLYGYVGGNPINFIDPSGFICFDFDQFANQVEENRFDLDKTLTTLGAVETIGTMPKTPTELRGLGIPKSKMIHYTSQLSRWSSRFKTRKLRVFGRKVAMKVLSKSAWDSTSSNDCSCK